MKISNKKIAAALDIAYKKAGCNAYFSNGFKAGINFAIQEVGKANIEAIAIIEQKLLKYRKLIDLSSQSIKDGSLKPNEEIRVEINMLRFSKSIKELELIKKALTE